MNKENHGDLKSFLEGQQSTCLSERSAKFVIEDALMALKDLYSIGLFHRDVQPKNFVVAAYNHFDNEINNNNNN